MRDWVRRITRIGGHTVSAETLWAVQWILGVLGVVWALFIGVFISLGGAERLNGELYQPLVAAFHDYHVIGAVSIVGGLLGIVGLARNDRRLSLLSSAICAVWNGLVAMFTIPANWSIPNGGNLLGFFALYVTVVYLMRFVLLRHKPGEDAVNLRG